MGFDMIKTEFFVGLFEKWQNKLLVFSEGIIQTSPLINFCWERAHSKNDDFFL